MSEAGEISVAANVPTPQLVDQMLREKPVCWQWAAFASVVFQRWAALEERKVNLVLKSAPPPARRLKTGPEVAHFVIQHMQDADAIMAEATAYLSASQFREAFAGSEGADSANTDYILASGHRLGDFYLRLLEVAESSRRVCVPARFIALTRDCTRFVHQSLRDFAAFVEDVLDLLEQLQERARDGGDVCRFEPVPLRTTTDVRLVWSIVDRLHASR